MALWDKLFKKKEEDSRKLNPIVQRYPPPSAPPRPSNARPAAPARTEMTVPTQAEPSTKARGQDDEPQTKSRKKKGENGTQTRTRAADDAALLKRGQHRQSQGDHDGAIQDFTKAIELNPNLAQAYASRGVSKEAKGDGAGAKSDYSQSIQIEIMSEINRQMSQNPDVEL